MDQAQAGEKTGSKPPVHTSGSVLDTFFDNVQRRYITLKGNIGTTKERESFYRAMDSLSTLYFMCPDCDSADCIHSFNLLDMFSRALLELRLSQTYQKQLEVSFERAKNEREDLAKKLEHSESAREVLKTRIGALEVAAKQHKFNHENFKRERKELRDQINALQKQLDEAKQALEERSAQLTGYEALRAKLNEQEVAIASLEELATMPPPQSSEPPSEVIIAEREAALEMAIEVERERAIERDELQAKANAAIAELARTKETAELFEVADAELAEAAKNIRNLEAANLAIANQRDQLALRCQELNSELDKKQEEHRNAKRLLESQLTELSEHLNKLREKHETVLGNLAKHQAMVAELEELATKPSAESIELQSAKARITELEAQSEHLRGKQADLQEILAKNNAELEEQLAAGSEIISRMKVELEAEKAKSTALAEERNTNFKRIAALEAELSKVAEAKKAMPDPVSEAEALLAKLDSVKADLASKLSALASPEPTQASTPVDASELSELEQKLGQLQDLQDELTDLSEEVFNTVEEQKYCIEHLGRKIKDTVKPLGAGDIALAKQDIADREAEVASLMQYLSDVQKLNQALDADKKAVKDRMALHGRFEDNDYLKALSNPLPTLPTPPFPFDVEFGFDGESPEEDSEPVATEENVESLETGVVSADELERMEQMAKQHGINRLELLLVTLCELRPNSNNGSSINRVINSAVQSGVAKFFQTNRKQLLEVWMDGKLDDRRIGEWMYYSGNAGKVPMYRRKHVEIPWEANSFVSESLRAAFQSTFNSYGQSKKAKAK